MSNLPFRTSTQLQPPPAHLVANWRIKKDINAESPEFKERVGQLSIVEQDVLKYYAGDTTETRTIVLERMEAYRQQNNNQPPIAAPDSQRRAGGANTGWICNICSGRFTTFQKAAIHVTSNEWNLFSWPCPMRFCGRTYKALDQLRRHTSKSHPNASPSTESTTPPESAPAPQPRTIPADEFRLQPRPFTGLPDGYTQVATPFSSKYVESGIESTNQQWPQFQPQASSVFNQQPLPAALNRSFGNDISNLYHSSWHGTFGSMNTWPPSVIDVSQQFPSTGDTQHVQPCANQSLPQSNRSRSGAVTPWYDDPTFSQLGSGISLPSNTFEGLMKYPVPLTRSKGDSSLETEMHQQTSRAFPSSARWGEQDCIDLGEDLLSRAQSFQRSPRDIPQFQPGTPPMFDELVGLPTQPSMGQFSTDGIPPLYQTSWHNTSGSMNLPPPDVTDAGQQIQPARSTRYGPATVNKPAANTQFGSDSSLASNDPSHLMDNLRSHNESQGYQEGVVHGQPSGVTPPSLEEWMTLFKFDEEFPDP